MEANRFICPSSSQAAAPLLFVPKKDGCLRLCVDYQALNAITVKDHYPIPLISKHLDHLATAKVFTKLDLKGAYNLLRIAPGHEWKTAFRTCYNSYEYLVMPFGLCNAPATFQRLMNHVLSDLLDVSVIVYLDDILIFSEDAQGHPHHVRQVIKRLCRHQLYCNPDKCLFSTAKVEFLGYVVSPEGISMDSSKVSTVLEWPLPASIQQIQVFLGFANFYRRFIQHYSCIAAPLTDLLKGAPLGKIMLLPEAVAAFEKLKQAFTKAPILKHFAPDLPTVLETDASDVLGLLPNPFVWAQVILSPKQRAVGVRRIGSDPTDQFCIDWLRRRVRCDRFGQTTDQLSVASPPAPTTPFKRHYRSTRLPSGTSSHLLLSSLSVNLSC
ncbi:uncharacterized protein UTRI_10099 [Ustilago trichophora]|uniref:Reverse transcriptase domain-containing protein n=1 Tax=Ustilago trichophora TaxID=86804 RepID=A0A5C3E3N0_9BASI|nr:uncharacterized protein UTRI_10099 [Ustilago trichophora]